MRNSLSINPAIKEQVPANKLVVMGPNSSLGDVTSLSLGVNPKNPVTYTNYAKKVRGPDRYYDICLDNTKATCDQWELNSSHSYVAFVNHTTPPNGGLYGFTNWSDVFIQTHDDNKVYVEYKINGKLYRFSKDVLASTITNLTDIAPLDEVAEDNFPFKVTFQNNKNISEIRLTADTTKLPNNFKDLNPERLTIGQANLDKNDMELDVSHYRSLAPPPGGLWIGLTYLRRINFSNCQSKYVYCIVNPYLESIDVTNLQYGDEENGGYSFDFYLNYSLPSSEIDKLVIGAHKSGFENGKLDLRFGNGPSTNVASELIDLIDRNWNIVL